MEIPLVLVLLLGRLRTTSSAGCKDVPMVPPKKEHARVWTSAPLCWHYDKGSLTPVCVCPWVLAQSPNIFVIYRSSSDFSVNRRAAIGQWDGTFGMGWGVGTAGQAAELQTLESLLLFNSSDFGRQREKKWRSLIISLCPITLWKFASGTTACFVLVLRFLSPPLKDQLLPAGRSSLVCF